MWRYQNSNEHSEAEGEWYYKIKSFLGAIQGKSMFLPNPLRPHSPHTTIPVTRVSNGKGGWADLIPWGNWSLHTVHRGHTLCRGCGLCRQWVASFPASRGGGSPLWVVSELRGVDLPYSNDIFIILGWNLNHGITSLLLYIFCPTCTGWDRAEGPRYSSLYN